MPKPKVLVVYKESTYSRYSSSEKIVRGFKKRNYWAVLKGSHDKHNRTLMGVCGVLKAAGFEVTRVFRNRVETLKNVDEKFQFAVSVGGDGTFLDASHRIKNIPLLGVNSDPLQSVGRLSGSRLENFPKILKAYLNGRLKPILVSRLEFFLNGKKSEWKVLNDLLICTANPAGTSRYILKVGPQKEAQMSSGVWVGTAAGSTAAIYSAGGRVLPADGKRFQFVAREVYQKKYGPRRLLKGLLSPNQTLEMISYMREGLIFIDGANLVVPFRVGDKLKVRISSQPLKVIGLKK